MHSKKITIVGNSVSIRTRPHIAGSSKNYGQLLVEGINEDSRINNSLWTAENLGFGRATIYDIQKIKPDIINSFGDVYLLNIGVCDAATREIPLWWSNFMNQPTVSWSNAFFSALHRELIKPNRRFFVKLLGHKSWVPQKAFERLYQQLIEMIQQNTSGVICCLSILPANDRVENQLPGSRDRYVRYNKIILDLCKKYDCRFIDLSHFQDVIHYPDGTHMNDLGHKEVAKKIMVEMEESLFAEDIVKD